MTRKENDMRIVMKETHNFQPKNAGRITVKYIGGEEYTVKREWGALMVRRGVATEIKAPPRPKAEA